MTHAEPLTDESNTDDHVLPSGALTSNNLNMNGLHITNEDIDYLLDINCPNTITELQSAVFQAMIDYLPHNDSRHLQFLRTAALKTQSLLPPRNITLTRGPPQLLNSAAISHAQTSHTNEIDKSFSRSTADALKGTNISDDSTFADIHTFLGRFDLYCEATGATTNSDKGKLAKPFLSSDLLSRLHDSYGPTLEYPALQQFLNDLPNVREARDNALRDISSLRQFRDGKSISTDTLISQHRALMRILPPDSVNINNLRLLFESSLDRKLLAGFRGFCASTRILTKLQPTLENLYEFAREADHLLPLSDRPGAKNKPNNPDSRSSTPRLHGGALDGHIPRIIGWRGTRNLSRPHTEAECGRH